MLAFYRSSVPSFLPSRSHSLLQLAPSHPPLPQSLSFPLPRVPQAGSDAASGAGGRPPCPGPRWVLGAATPEAGPGSPAPRPARPDLRRATGRCGWEKRETKGEAFKGGSLPWRLKLMGTRRQGEDPSFTERISFVAGRTPFRIRHCPGLTKIGGFRPESGISRG